MLDPALAQFSVDEARLLNIAVQEIVGDLEWDDELGSEHEPIMAGRYCWDETFVMVRWHKCLVLASLSAIIGDGDASRELLELNRHAPAVSQPL